MKKYEYDVTQSPPPSDVKIHLNLMAQAGWRLIAVTTELCIFYWEREKVELPDSEHFGSGKPF